jgi:hypothetical protein
VTIKTPGV